MVNGGDKPYLNDLISGVDMECLYMKCTGDSWTQSSLPRDTEMSIGRQW